MGHNKVVVVSIDAMITSDVEVLKDRKSVV